MADANIEVYAVVDKSKKNQKSFMLLPNDETEETDPPPPIPERSEALESEYSMITADTAVDYGTEKKEGAVLETVGAAAMPVGPAEEFDSTYSTITVHQPANPEKKGEGVKMDADSKPTPEGTLQHPMTTAPAKSARSFYSEYSMVALDNVHSTVNDGDLQSQQPTETDMGTGKTVAKAIAQGSFGGKNKTAIMCFSIFIAIAFIIALVASVAFLFIKVGNLEAETAALHPGQLAALDSSIMGQLQQIDDSIAGIKDLNNSVNYRLNMSLDNLKHELSEDDQIQATHTMQLNNSIEMLHRELEQLHLATNALNASIQTIDTRFNEDITAIENKTKLLVDYIQIGLFHDNPTPSCAVLKARGLSPSGYYWVRTSNGSAVRVYCDMTRLCGGVTGGWVRVAYLDKTNSSQNGLCPSGFNERTFSSIPTCRRDDTSAGCSSVLFTTHELSYSKVCGRITALADGAPEGFMRTNSTGINGTYVDGVSLTHGAPRQHIWTFAATSSEANRMLSCSCKNSNTEGTHSPEYVGNDYFCDTRFRETEIDADLVLWQGTDCTSSNACCSFNNPPWFYKQLPQPTTDDIEMRVCRDEVRGSEDVLIQIAEVYIQ